ncbi:MAG: hypothetical protein J6U96_01040 [Elusimicrobiaceae bacterium]|nr:hypothetical protein [Elusimicrobiaceae bacterium]
MKKILFFALLIVTMTPLWAGIAPKPEMDFTLIYATENKPAVLPDTSEQIQCEDNQCLQSDPLGAYGIQKLYCKADGCFSIAYEYAPFQQLVLDFADGKKRASNVFSTPSKLRNSFTVTVREKDLLVQPSATPQQFHALLRADAWMSLIIILLLEMIAAWAYLKYTRKSFRVLYAVVIANLISMPLSWQVLGRIATEQWFIWFFCLIFEALFIWIFNRKRITARDSFELSFAINVTSYSVGMILSFLIAPYLF